MGGWRRIAALAAWLWLAMPAAASQFSDLWWNPQEGGWGASVVQQGDVAFVMLYVYGTDGQPRWYFASDARAVAYSSHGLPVFSGTLYRSAGPWYGGPFDAQEVHASPVGQVSLEPIAPDALRLWYVAEGVVVTKYLHRLSWRAPEVSGYYLAAFDMRYALPGSPPYGARRFAAELVLDAEGTNAVLRIEDPPGRNCELRGRHAQAGKLGGIIGTYVCTDGEAGSFEVKELEVTAVRAISGHLQMRSLSGEAFGRFSAVR